MKIRAGYKALQHGYLLRQKAMAGSTGLHRGYELVWWLSNSTK